MEGSELTSKFERRTPMENIEYYADKVKAERDAVEDRAATGTEIQPGSDGGLLQQAGGPLAGRDLLERGEYHK
jgi:hypothetical protein